MIDGAPIQHPTCGKGKIEFPGLILVQCARTQSIHGKFMEHTFRKSDESAQLSPDMSARPPETF
jgi:hypothetical protein